MQIHSGSLPRQIQTDEGISIGVFYDASLQKTTLAGALADGGITGPTPKHSYTDDWCERFFLAIGGVGGITGRYKGLRLYMLVRCIFSAINHNHIF